MLLKGEKMHIVLDEVMYADEKFEDSVWYEVYVVDKSGKIVSETDDIYGDLDSAFEAIKKLSKRFL